CYSTNALLSSFPTRRSSDLTIVDILLQHRDTLGFVAEVLQTCRRPDEPSLAKMLVGIRHAYSQLDAEGNTILPTHIGNLTEILGDRKSTRLNSSHLVISYAV